MQHLPEILKIVESGLKRDVPRLLRYTELLASKLDAEGDAPSAGHLRKTMASLKPKSLQPAEVSVIQPAPVDSEARVSLAEVSHPRLEETPLVLGEQADATLTTFTNSYQRMDELLSAGLSGPGHILLYGPPGCGKTQAAKHLAARLGLPLVTARLDGLISSFLGSTAKNIRSLFDFVERNSCVFLLDEFDAIAKMRDDPHELGELKRVVNSLLQNIDLLPQGTVLAAATNHEHLLDSAVWRRFEFHIRIDLPNLDLRRMLVQLYSPVRTATPTDLDVLAALTEGLSGGEIRTICGRVGRQTVLEGRRHLHLPEAVDAIALLRPHHEQDGHEAMPTKLEDRIRYLRKLDAKIFTYDVISKILGVSKGKISNVLTGR